MDERRCYLVEIWDLNLTLFLDLDGIDSDNNPLHIQISTVRPTSMILKSHPRRKRHNFSLNLIMPRVSIRRIWRESKDILFVTISAASSPPKLTFNVLSLAPNSLHQLTNFK